MFAGRHHLDPGTDGRPIGFHALELDGEPVIPLARVLKQDVVVLVAVGRAAHLDEEVDVAVAIPVGAGDAVALLEVPGARSWP